MSGASAGQKLAALLADVVDGTGLDLEAVLVSGQGRRTEVRVLVDKDGVSDRLPKPTAVAGHATGVVPSWVWDWAWTTYKLLARGKNFAAATAEAQFPLPLVPPDFGLKGAVFADAGVLYGLDVPAACAALMTP